MRLLFALLIICLVSCRHNDAPKEPLAVAKAPVPDTIPFKAFNYRLGHHYVDSIACSIIPDRKYDYWAFLTGRYRDIKLKDSLPITVEKGDTLLRAKIKLPDSPGFFKGGQFTMRSDYIAIVHHDSLRFITTNAAFRDFLGTIDNVDEAVLLAETYYYMPDYNCNGKDYRMVNGNYEMRLRRFDPIPSCIPMDDPNDYKTVTATQDGFIKVAPRKKDKATKKP